MSIRLISDFFAGFGKYGTTFARFLGYGAILELDTGIGNIRRGADDGHATGADTGNG